MRNPLFTRILFQLFLPFKICCLSLYKTDEPQILLMHGSVLKGRLNSTLHCMLIRRWLRKLLVAIILFVISFRWYFQRIDTLGLFWRRLFETIGRRKKYINKGYDYTLYWGYTALKFGLLRAVKTGWSWAIKWVRLGLRGGWECDYTRCLSTLGRESVVICWEQCIYFIYTQGT